MFLGLHYIDWTILALYLTALIVIGRIDGAARGPFHRAIFSGGTQLRQMDYGVPEFREHGFRRPGRRRNARNLPAGIAGRLVPKSRAVHHAVLLVHLGSPAARAVSGSGRYLRTSLRIEISERAFAVYLLLAAIYGSSIGYLITGKTMQAVMLKPPSAYTMQEKQSVAEFQDMRALDVRASRGTLSDSLNQRLTYLHQEEQAGKITGTISYLHLVTFYLIYGGVTAAYVIMGGLFAAAFTDVMQGILVLFLSTILIPVGLAKLGGFAGLHARVGANLFQLFGTTAGSEYTWWFVATMVLVNLIGLAPRSFTLGGAAKDDNAARTGMVGGAFLKRFVMIGWALTGLIAIALYSGKLSDATYIWGTMTQDLLGAGFVGLMIASVLAANMASKASSSLEWSAAFTKNILVPLRPNTTEQHPNSGRAACHLHRADRRDRVRLFDERYFRRVQICALHWNDYRSRALACLFLAKANHQSGNCANAAFDSRDGSRAQRRPGVFVASILARAYHYDAWP